MSYSQEFQTVDLILQSNAETLGVDAFALSLIKAERQLRRLVTHLVFQFPCFGCSDITALRQALGDNQRVYFEGFEEGFDAIYPKAVKDLFGAQYVRLRPRLNEAIDFRNKIFHGQLTFAWLNRKDLLSYVADIREWCQILAESTLTEFRYDGFGRDSFRKSDAPGLVDRYKLNLADVAAYDHFIQQYMQRP